MLETEDNEATLDLVKRQSKLLTSVIARVIPVIRRALVPYIRDSPLAKNSSLIIHIGCLYCYLYPPTFRSASRLI